MVMHGRMTRRGPKRSSMRPINGEEMPRVMAASPKPIEMDSRPQPNEAPSGFTKTENVYTNREPNPAITPQQAARTTRQP